MRRIPGDKPVDHLISPGRYSLSKPVGKVASCLRYMDQILSKGQMGLGMFL